MTFSTHKQKIPSKKSPFWWYPAKNLHDMYVSLHRYNFVAKVINNGHMEVKNSLGRKQRM